jgi:hypothetical protein
VINLPTKFGTCVPVVGILHRVTARISAPDRRAKVLDPAASFPDEPLAALVRVPKRTTFAPPPTFSKSLVDAWPLGRNLPAMSAGRTHLK